MWKVLGGVFLGVFMGALVYEIVDRENPELFQKVRDFVAGVAGDETDGMPDDMPDDTMDDIMEAEPAPAE